MDTKIDDLIALLKTRGISDPRVLSAIQQVPREDFLPAELHNLAYEDTALPLVEGQTISQPFVVAWMTSKLLQNESLKTILEIGTGWGYQAAVLSLCVERVITIELRENLQREASKRLISYPNVISICGNGFAGYPSMAPYDGIIVTAAPTEIPDTLIAQLKVGARMVIPVGERDAQQLLLIRKLENSIEKEALGDVRFVPMVNSS